MWSLKSSPDGYWFLDQELFRLGLPDSVTDAMKEARARRLEGFRAPGTLRDRLSSMETPCRVYFELPEEETAEAMS